MKKSSERKKFKMKKSVRLTIAGVLAVTALVVAIIPTRGVQAGDPFNPEKDIPSDVDVAIAQDPFVNGNSVIPNDTTKHWAFPMGEELSIWDDAAGTSYTYYKINRDGMYEGYDAMPVFEISSTSTPASTLPQCIKNYCGGETSGYTPAGGILQLSTAVIYTDATETARAPYIHVEGGDPVEHTPKTWTRYTETKITHDPNDDMAKFYPSMADTPSYYYYNIMVETWTRPWTQDPLDETIWYAPDDGGDPITLGEDPDSRETIKEVCKKNTLVSYIADGAFKGVANFTSMEILNEGTSGIYMIGDSAFEDCTQLQAITFGSNFKSIGKKAFNNCSSLTSINFGVSTQSIGDGCFANCTALPSVALPINLQNLGTAAFFNCRALQDTIPDFLTNDDHNSMIFGGTDTEMGINSALTIGSYAFANCTSLTNTKMCQTTQPITGGHGRYGMYAGCTNLNQIELPRFTTNFTTTPSTFLGCPNLACVKGSSFTATATDRQFINSLNQQTGEEVNVSENFVIWGPNPNESSSIALLSYAQKNSLPYMYYDRADSKFKYIMTLDNSYKFTFTDDFIIESITQLPGATAETIRIPATIGGHAIGAIADDACGKVQGTSYVSNLTKPTKIEISDAIGQIGENAFRSCTSVEEVDFVHIPFTTSAAQTSIGANCFKDCKNLDIVKFRDDNFDGNGYYDINIDSSSVGADAFLTNNPNGLTMCGKMEQGYWPYEYAIDPNNIACSTKADSYITYRSGNPWNIECKYCKPSSAEPGYVSLIEYPTVNTVVGSEAVESPAGSGHFIDQDVTIYDLIMRYTGGETLTPNQEEIINLFTKNINVPYGITSILESSNDLGTETAPDSSDNDYFIGANDYKTGYAYNLTNLSFDSLEKLPTVSSDKDKPFSECKSLETINFNGNMKDLGILPFYNVPKDLITAPLATLKSVNFNNENDKDSATIDDPYYWCDNGIIYSYYRDDDGEGVTTIVEVLESRGMPGGVGSALVNEENDPCLADVTNIDEGAFKNCDYITSVDLMAAKDLKTIPEECFYNCNLLKYVTLPANIKEVQSKAFQENDNLKDITIYGRSINIDEDAFTGTESTVFHAYEDSSVPSYVKMVNKKEHRSSADELIYELMTEEQKYTVIFIDGIDYSEFYRETVPAGWNIALPTAPEHENYVFAEYYSKPANAWVNVQADATVYAKYTMKSTSSSSSSSSSSSKSSSSKTSTSSKTSSSGSSSSSSKVSTSIKSTTAQPVIISGTGTLVGAGASVPAVNLSATNGNGTSNNSGNSGNNGGAGFNNNNVGKTKLISTTGGISDTSKLSATVNGSSDNYVIKISETEEANNMADQALLAAYGSLDAIRYLPIDISLYDSTGTQKISPVPDGININITMPIPDILAIYGGNAKVACTETGMLDKIQPKFTVINGVPCMNFTVNHLSPYVIYVDTNNLTAVGTLDSTPKTGDPIHPKWFLVIGLAAVSGIMFLKRDKKETFEAV